MLFYKLGKMSGPRCAEVQALSAPGGRLPRLRAGGESNEGGTAGDPVAFITVRPGTAGRLDLESLRPAGAFCSVAHESPEERLPACWPLPQTLGHLLL